MATARMVDQVGRVLEGRYRLHRLLGSGASAHVYVAEDIRLRRRVAVKVLHPMLAGDEAFGRRFRTEAQVVAALRHPHIARVYDWGSDEGVPFLVMELLEGGSLRSLLDTGYRLTPAQLLRLGIEAAGALDHAHRRGLVHRDIKPANLIFDDESRVTVADFGLARALAEATVTEPAGAVVGTARYAAPEQVRGQTLDDRADVYALALVLVEAATGRVPFATDTTLGTLMARVERPLDVGADLGPLTPLLEAAGTVDPADRLDAASLRSGLQELAERIAPGEPLPLVGPLVDGRPERDEQPTATPAARVVPFDIDALDPVGTAPTGELAPAGDELGPQERPKRSTPSAPSVPSAPRARRRRWLAVAVTLAVLAAVAGAVVVVDPFRPTHPVPNVKGIGQAAAVRELHGLHLDARVGARLYASAALGTVIDQKPSTGRLGEGSTVTLTLSAGPRPVAIPDLGGQARADASASLVAAGLKVGSVSTETSLTVTAGSVIRTSPAAGASLPPGQPVDLVVSAGKPTIPVPAVSGGASYASAQAAIGAVGLVAAEGFVYSDTVSPGAVVSSLPAGGTPAPLGSTVTVEVSKGPDLVAVPSVRGDSVASASAALTAAGFVVSGVSGNPTATATGTTPAAGTRAHRGVSVQIVTG